jgi:hypothetical protein
MTNLLQSDDATADYLKHRASADDPLARALQRMATEPAPDSSRTAGDVAKGAALEAGTAVAKEAPAGQPEQSFGDRALSVAKDIGRGIVEAPAQAIGGVSDAVHAAFAGLDQAAWWLEKHAPLGTYEGFNPLAAAAGPEKAMPVAESTTGNAVREVSRFVAGFLPALRATKSVAAVPVAGRVAKPALAGGLADFATKQGQEEKLSDLWQELGLPSNILTDYLASDPDDTEFDGRLKNAIEGVVLGGAADALLISARVLRNLRRTPGAAASAEAEVRSAATELQARYGEVSDRDFLTLGDPNEPLLRLEARTAKEAAPGEKVTAALTGTELGVPDDVAAKGLALSGDEGGKEVFVNFGRIETPDDVKSVIGQMADAFKGQVDEARRGVQSNEETARLADELGMGVGDLLARRKGQPFNAEEALAARRLWASSAEKLLEVAKVAASPNAGPVDQYAFRKMMAIHQAVQAEVIGARTETARALQAWSIPAGGGVEKARAVEQLMESMGGPGVSQEIARRLAMLDTAGATPAAINQFVRGSWGARTVAAVQEFWVNALLSSPTTHVVNTSSNMMVAFQQIYERGVAASVAGLREGEVAPGEAAAMAYGLIEGMKDAFRLSWKALKTEQTGAALGKVDLPHTSALSAEAFNASGTGVGRVVDLLGTVTRVPSRLLGAEDEFFKTIGYRMELHAQALRQAHQEGMRGEALGRRVAEIVQNPPEHIRIRAADQALYQTFTNQPGAVGQTLANMRAKLPLTGFVLPFVRTPVNITRYAIERSPMAPLARQWRDDIAAGGARKDLALARMTTGSTIMLLAADFAERGTVTGKGPDDQGEREALTRQGWQPYSIKVGDRYYSYNRTDPFGMTMGFAADMVEMVRRHEIEPDEVDEVHELLGAALLPISQVTINKTYMSGMAEFIEMVANPDRHAPAYVERFIGSFVPAGVAMAERVVDPRQSEVMNAFDAVQARIPVLASKLPPKRDLWGQATAPDSGFGTVYDALSPVAVKQAKESPVDSEAVRLNLDLQRIEKKASWGGVPVNFRDHGEVYDAYVRLAGNELKHPVWGLGAKDFLDAVVSGKHELSSIYQMGSDGEDGGKAKFIRKTISEYRQLARDAVENDPQFKEFREMLEQRRTEQQARQMPRIQ